MNHRLSALVLGAVALIASSAPPAGANGWEVVAQPGGYRVAKVASTGAILSMGLVCERTIPLLALRLARAPARNPALLGLTNGAATGKFAIARNGTTNTWAGPVRDARVLDMLAREASIEVAIDGVRYGTVSLAGAADAMRGALGGCYAGLTTNAATKPPVATKVNDPDENAVRAIVGSIYGWRDGRKVKTIDDWQTSLFSRRINQLFAQCEEGIANADPKANGGEGSYAETGDQGCLGAPFLVELITYDPAPFIPQSRPAVRRIDLDTIESEIVVPPRHHAEWGRSETIRFQRNEGRWLIDEITTQRDDGTVRYSAQIADTIVALRKIARKPAAKRRR